MAVLSLLVVMLMGIVDSATKLWRENENRVESYREARVAMSMIASDLRSLHPSANANFFQIVPSEDDADGALAFLAALPLSAQDSSNKSDLCAVGYFLDEGPVSDFAQPGQSPAKTFNLYRYLVESDETFERLTNNPVNPGFWPAEFSWESDPRPEILARNIRAFRVRAFNRDGSNWVEWTESPDRPMPDLLEIEIEAVNDQIRTRFDGNLKDARLDPPNEHVRVLTTRIPLRQPLPTQTP